MLLLASNGHQGYIASKSSRDGYVVQLDSRSKMGRKKRGHDSKDDRIRGLTRKQCRPLEPRPDDVDATAEANLLALDMGMHIEVRTVLPVTPGSSEFEEAHSCTSLPCHTPPSRPRLFPWPPQT